MGASPADAWVNTLLVLATIGLADKTSGGVLIVNYGATWFVYMLLILPAALSRRRGLVAPTIGLHIAIYVAIATATLVAPSLSTPETAVASKP